VPNSYQPSVRKISRRKIATLIRVRQEVHKRLDAAFSSRPAGPVASVLDARLVSTAPTAAVGDTALCELLAARAAKRYPLAHLSTRPLESLPGRGELLASAARLARGAWTLFGAELHIDLPSHDWTRHPITGVRAADVHWTRVPYMTGIGGGDVKQIWELSRHAELVRLAQAYHLTTDEAFANAALDLLARWIEQNPVGRGINWTSSLEVAFRAIAWCWIRALTSRASWWDDARLGRFLQSLWHHARHIARFDSVHHSPNTHLTGEALGLLYVGLFFPELNRAAEWTALARAILDEELDVQVLPDGMHFERSTGYHRYTLEFYAHYLLLADAFGVPCSPRLRERVRDQAVASWLLQRPDGSWPVFGDEDSGSTLRLSPADPQDQRSILTVAAALCDDQRWLPNADAPAGAAWWLLEQPQWDRLRAMQARGARTMAPSGELPSAGYYVGRDVGDTTAWYCAVDAGPHGGDRTGHAHTDLGHVEIAHGATRLVADPGCATYTTAPQARDEARAERVHACLVLDGEPMAVPAGPFSWSRLAPTPEVDWAEEHDLWWCELHYDRPHAGGTLTHRRQVVLAHGTAVAVCDWLTGDQARAAALHWPLGIVASRAALSGDALTTAEHRIAWYGSGGHGALRASLERLITSPGYGRAMDGQLLRVVCAAPIPATIVTTFADSSVTLSVRLLDGGRVALSLGDGGGGRHWIIGPGSAPVRELVAVAAHPRAEGVLG